MKATGAILAGGRSSRMKSNKAFVEIAGRPVINIIIDKFAPYFDDIIIISNEPDLYDKFGYPVFTDIYPRLGPVSGIHSALFNSKYEQVFVMGCDMPFMNMELVTHMLEMLGEYDSAVPEIDTHLQPLSAVYNRKCLRILANCLENNRLKLTRIFREELNALVLPRKILQNYGIVEHMFLNVNDLEALQRATEFAGRFGI